MTPSDVKTVADNLDDFIEVPDGIARLRKAVFELAVSGKLVHQDAKEGTAEELFGRKSKKDAVGRSKKKKVLAPSALEETPFGIPSSWKWVRFGDVCDAQGGAQPPKSKFVYEETPGYVRFLQIRDFSSEKNLTYIPVNNKNKMCAAEDILIGRYGASVGKVLTGQSGAYNVAIIKTFPDLELLNRKYFYYFLLSEYMQAWFSSLTRAAQAGFNKDDLFPRPFPLPPLAEQARIAKKVEEVMKQLDDLETKKRERDEVRTCLAKSAMQSLGKGDSKIAFEQLSELIKTQTDLKELEGALLTLAVSGKLVPQDAKEGTAEEYYEQILAIRTEEGGRGGRLKTRNYTPITNEEEPFEIPKSWKWARLGVVTNYGQTEKFKGNKIDDGTWILELEDLEKDGGRIIDVVEYPRRKPQSDKNIFRKGDVLYGKLRPYLNKVLVAPRGGLSTGELLPLRWYGTGSPEYLRLVMLSDYFYSHVNKRTYGMKMPRLGTEDGQDAPIPLPPLAEQIRIAKKVEDVMGLVGRLREVMGETRTQGRGRPRKQT